MATAKPWYVYVLECVDGSLYTGIAVDVHRRYALHAAGKGARYTRAHPPRRLAALLPCPDRSAASRAEYRVKRMSRAQKLALCLLLPAPEPTPLDRSPPSAAGKHEQRQYPAAQKRDDGNPLAYAFGQSPRLPP